MRPADQQFSAAVAAIGDRLFATGHLGDRENLAEYATCVPAMLVALNWSGDLKHVCDALPYRPDPLDEDDFLNFAWNLGFLVRPAHMRLDDIDRRLLPCLFVADKDDNDRGKVLVLLKDDDAATGDADTVFSGKQNALVEIPKGITGTAYFFQQRDPDHDGAAVAPGMSWFRSSFRHFHGALWHIIIASFLLNLFSLAPVLFVMTVFDRVIRANAAHTLDLLVIGVFGAITIEAAIRYLRLRGLAWFSTRFDNIVSNAIMQHILSLPPAYIERSAVAAQIARIRTFESVREFFMGPIFLAVLELPFILVVVAAIGFIAGPLALVPVVLASIYILLILVLRPGLRGAIHASAKAESEMRRMTMETLSKINVLRYSGMTEGSMERLRELSGRTSYFNFRSAFLASIIENIGHGLSLIAGVTVLGFGIGYVWSGALTVGGLVATMILVWRALSPLQIACSSLPRIEQLLNTIRQVNRLMDITPERDSHVPPSASSRFKGHLSFAKVGLRYTKEADPVFAGLTFDVRPGEMVAIIGDNGSGKSTVLKLVNRLYTPQAGTISIDGVDIRQIDPIVLRRKISYVPSTPEFFMGTVTENLRFADPLASEEDLKQALRDADALEDVQALPNGLDTLIGLGSRDRMPSGLEFRLNLARAYLKNSAIMLFDDLPFAFLNSKSADAFLAFLKQSKGRRTVLLATHRDDYIKIADKVVLLQANERPIVGSPDDVLRRRAA